MLRGVSKLPKRHRINYHSHVLFRCVPGNVVLEIPRTSFEDEIDDVKFEKNVYEDSKLSADDLREVVSRFKGVYEESGLSFPQDAREQLSLAIGAVFRGWMGPRAVKYRDAVNIRNLLGTAVNVQAVVVGVFRVCLPMTFSGGA